VKGDDDERKMLRKMGQKRLSTLLSDNTLKLQRF
jgi:hypothetical protein